MRIAVQEKIMVVYWVVLLFSTTSLFLDLRHMVITEALLMPLLMLYMFMRDGNIAHPLGKLVFFTGMFFALLGDVLQIVIDNEIFFLSSLVAFMLMNTCYSISFAHLLRGSGSKPWIFIVSCLLLGLAGYYFIRLMGDERLGYFKIPLIIYIITLGSMIALSVSLADTRYRKTALTRLLPGALIFMLQNIFLAINLFQLGSDSKLYTLSILPYGVAQFLMVKGMRRIYSS